jgi:hypothetical protein
LPAQLIMSCHPRIKNSFYRTVVPVEAISSLNSSRTPQWACDSELHR